MKDAGGRERVFDPIRYQYSLSLPKILEEIFCNPVKGVSRTEAKNYFVYYLEMTPALPKDHRYYIFFNMRLKEKISYDLSPRIAFSVTVESAYAKATRVGVVSTQPLGRVAENIARG